MSELPGMWDESDFLGGETDSPGGETGPWWPEGLRGIAVPAASPLAERVVAALGEMCGDADCASCKTMREALEEHGGR
jgi:hypothetical protein